MIREKSDQGSNSKRTKQESTSPDVCERHKQPLAIFCNNPDCQVVVCQTCVLLKHKDHEVIEITEKYEELQEEIKDIEKNITKASEVYNTLTEKIHREKNTVSAKTSDALEKIEAAKGKLIARIEKEEEMLTKNAIEIQEKQLSSFEETLRVITAKSRRLEETRSLITELTSEINIQNAMAKQAAIEQIYKEGLSNRKEIEKWVKQYDIVIFEDGSKVIEVQNMLGNVATKQNEIKYPLMGAVCHPSADKEPSQSDGNANTNAILRQEASSTGVQNKKITAVKVASWRPRQRAYNVSCSPTGIIYTASDNKIQVFDMNGVLKIEVDVPDSEILGMQ